MRRCEEYTNHLMKQNRTIEMELESEEQEEERETKEERKEKGRKERISRGIRGRRRMRRKEEKGKGRRRGIEIAGNTYITRLI